MTNLAVIDLDGVVANSSERFKRAEEAKAAFLDEQARIPGLNWNGVKQQANNLYWQTAFTPEMVALDTPLEGAIDALTTLAFNGYEVAILTSRPESMREATRRWLFEQDYPIESPIIMKSSAFQFVKTTVWKAGMVQTLASLYSADIVKFVDDDEANWQELLKYTPYVNYSLEWCKSLKELIEYLEECKATED